MERLPATWTALCVLAFVLGARHGFDADHRMADPRVARSHRRRRLDRIPVRARGRAVISSVAWQRPTPGACRVIPGPGAASESR